MRTVRRSLRLLPLLFPLLFLTLGPVPPSPAATSPMPTEQQWIDLTARDLTGAQDYVRDRVAQGAHGRRLALNLDIDNTSLATYYDRGHAVRATLDLATYAHSQGVSVLFNTGRWVSMRSSTLTELRAAGYPVDGLCTRYRGEALEHSKQRCRASFVRHGFTLIANVGNRSFDFVGRDYERRYWLPNFGNRLG